MKMVIEMRKSPAYSVGISPGSALHDARKAMQAVAAGWDRCTADPGLMG